MREGTVKREGRKRMRMGRDERGNDIRRRKESEKVRYVQRRGDRRWDR